MDAARRNGGGGDRIGRAGIKHPLHAKHPLRNGENQTRIGTPFGTIEIGVEGLMTGPQILDALMAKFPVGDCTIQMLWHADFKPCDTRCALELARLCPRDVGFRQGVHLGEFYRHIQGMQDLQLCPAETAPLLLLSGACDNQLPGQIILTAMEPIWDKREEPGIFGIAHDYNRGRRRGGGLWVRAFDGQPHAIFPAGQQFLFARSITMS